MNALAPVSVPDFSPIVTMVLDSVPSDNSKRVYKKSLNDFLAWLPLSGYSTLNRAAVQRYRAERLEGLSPRTQNGRITPIKKLAKEAHYNGLPCEWEGIRDIKGVTAEGVRSGNWLTKEQAQELLERPDCRTIKGLRDRAILATLLGCGLRRDELANLTFEHIQLREARWCIVDLVGKRKKVRTVPMPAWCKAAIDEWAEAAHLATGKVFRGVYRYGHSLDPDSQGITSQVVYSVVREYSDAAPHDLRRTYAKLARKGGAELTQIQLTLGHASVQTTQRYVGEDLDLTDAPCDRLGLRI